MDLISGNEITSYCCYLYVFHVIRVVENVYSSNEFHLTVMRTSSTAEGTQVVLMCRNNLN